MSATPGWRGGDEASLRTWLEAHGVRLGGWGAGSAKTVHDLQQEVEAGETTLLVRDGKPLRQLSMCVQLLLRVLRSLTRPAACSCASVTSAGERLWRLRRRCLTGACAAAGCCCLKSAFVTRRGRWRRGAAWLRSWAVLRLKR